MAVAARAKPQDYFNQTEWAELSSRSPWRGLFLVAHCWGVIGLALACGVIWPITIPIAVLVIGGRQLGLAILMHDAAHANLHVNRRVNDEVAYWLCSPALHSYRPYHLQHHRYVQQTEDPDLVLSAPFPISPQSLRRKMLRDLTGQTFWKQRLKPALLGLGQMFKSKTSVQVSAPQVSAVDGDLEKVGAMKEGAVEQAHSEEFHARDARFLMGQALGLLLFTLAGYWWAWFALWLLPMATWLPLISRLRNIAEHALAAQNESDPLKQARTTTANWLARALLAPYWVNYHNEHHLFTQVPCWNLPKAHQLLASKGTTQHMMLGVGYLSVLRQASGKTA